MCGERGTVVGEKVVNDFEGMNAGLAGVNVAFGMTSGGGGWEFAGRAGDAAGGGSPIELPVAEVFEELGRIRVE